jgi:DNA-directed RNA polymerase subunit L
MNVKILQKSPDEIKVEIEGEGHTFCNMLQQVLLEDEAIETASYSIQHPLISSPIIYVRMKEGRKPEKRAETALREAVEKMRHRCKEFKESFEKALKE